MDNEFYAHGAVQALMDFGVIKEGALAPAMAKALVDRGVVEKVAVPKSIATALEWLGRQGTRAREMAEAGLAKSKNLAPKLQEFALKHKRPLVGAAAGGAAGGVLGDSRDSALVGALLGAGAGQLSTREGKALLRRLKILKAKQYEMPRVGSLTKKLTA